jgi:hypothetical protein
MLQCGLNNRAVAVSLFVCLQQTAISLVTLEVLLSRSNNHYGIHQCKTGPNDLSDANRSTAVSTIQQFNT